MLHTKINMSENRQEKNPIQKLFAITRSFIIKY
jgi:hypothetical protein